MEVGGRGGLYAYHYTVTTRMTLAALIFFSFFFFFIFFFFFFNVSLNVRDKVSKQVSTDHNF